VQPWVIDHVGFATTIPAIDAGWISEGAGPMGEIGCVRK
jgi:hypothetical protein